MKKLLITMVLLALAGCVSVVKMESGVQTLGSRMVVKLDGAWNHVNAPSLGPAQFWTMEGLPVDQMLIYTDIKDGETIHQGSTDASGKHKEFKFRSGMQPDEIVAMFEGMLARDGSSFKLVKLEPSTFGGDKGFRFEYSLIRKGDNVQLSGIGHATVSKGELFAILYIAPRMTFFSRHKDRVEEIARSARVKA